MTKEGIEYISNFIRNMTCDENVVKVLKQNYAIRVSRKDFDNFNMQENMEYFYCEYIGSRMIRAYEPFLDVIRDMVIKYEVDVNEMFETAQIYSLNRSMFTSYIEKGVAIKKEFPILAELEFDGMKIIRDIVSLLLYLADKKPIFILLNEANQMCDSTLKVLMELMEVPSFNLKILIIANEMGSIKSYVSQMYWDYMNQCEMKEIVSDWPFEGFSETPGEEITYVFKSSVQELDELCTMFFTGAYEQANYYLNIIYQKIELDKVDVAEDYRINILTLYILVSMCKENYSYALILCERIKRIENYHNNNRKDYLYYYFKATANMYIGNEDDAKKNAARCNKIAVKMGSEYEIFMSMLLMNMAELAGWKDIWLCEKDIDVSDELIKLCYEYDYLNHLAHIYVYCFDNDAKLYCEVDGVEVRTANVTNGIYLANKLGNEQLLVEAYRKNIMMASYNGFFPVADYFYKKSIEIVRHNGNKMEEANIYNGLGYNCCAEDKYGEANRYYNKALKIFYECKSSDYILETLYNMGINAILAGDYKHAGDYLLTVNNILTLLKMNSLRVCNIPKLFGLIAVAYFKQGNLYTARKYNDKSKNFLRYILEYCDSDSYRLLWDDDMFLFFYVSALLDWKSGKTDSAMENFDKAEVYMMRSTGSKFFNYMFFAVDKAEFLKELGRENEAVRLLTDAKTYFSNRGNFLRVKMFEDLLTTGEWNCPPMKMPLTDITIETLMEFIKHECVVNNAKARRKNIRFFGTFQELMNNSYNNEDNLIDTLVTNFKNNFNLDNMLVITFENEIAEIRYSDLEYALTGEEIQTILQHFKENSTGFALSKFSNNYCDYDKVVRIFDRSKVFSIVGVPIFRYEQLYSILITFVKIPESWNAVISREVLDNEDKEVFTIVFRQIIDAMEKYRLNDRLVRQAVTDELTGLFNRKGYYEMIDGMIKNTEQTGITFDCAFIYLDLDHFKYYNDNFGHQVGDAILKRFAEIFDKACGNDGFVVRFGGDEFVMLLKTVDRDDINRIVGKIYDLIEQEDGFVTLVRKYRGDNIDIPSDFRATCSIGVDTGRNIKSTAEISVLQRHADAALYHVKYNGRGSMMMYEEI